MRNACAHSSAKTTAIAARIDNATLRTSMGMRTTGTVGSLTRGAAAGMSWGGAVSGITGRRRGNAERGAYAPRSRERLGAYFKRMSFLTDLTPPTLRATTTALFIGLTRVHESAQLDHALERLDVDLGGLQRRFVEDGGLDLAGDDRVVDVFAGAFLLAVEAQPSAVAMNRTPAIGGDLRVDAGHAVFL